jgi:hypothetical protein
LPDALPLTARLRAAFRQRIELLPAAAQTALLIAAAHDDEDVTVLASAADSLDPPADALDPAATMGLVRIDGATVSFRHPLIRSVVYDSAPLGRRRQGSHGVGRSAFLSQRR